jgi:syntaxin-binding protein 1
MKDTLSALPQFQTLKAKFAIHINIAQECKSQFESRHLDTVAALQQVWIDLFRTWLRERLPLARL